MAEAHLTVLEEDREACLYYLLARHPGRTLVFVNAVSALRRVAALLKLLGLPAYPLHAQQQQRQRLKVGGGAMKVVICKRLGWGPLDMEWCFCSAWFAGTM